MIDQQPYYKSSLVEVLIEHVSLILLNILLYRPGQPICNQHYFYIYIKVYTVSLHEKKRMYM